ncbi:MAG: GNAT family N-acetyltransferase [Oscillospiraceae bacterium]|nr:GNAT family N-acetyltransferase [Oscillospiraceae bacterium]
MGILNSKNTAKNTRIETGRLMIRPFAKDDFEGFCKLAGGIEEIRYKNIGEMTPERYKKLFNRWAGSYNLSFNRRFTYCFYITLKETGAHIGWVGLGKLITDPKQTEMFVLIGKEHQNQGFAAEASAAMLEYGFDTVGLNEIVAVCRKENKAAVKTLEKTGFKFKYTQENHSKEFADRNGDPFYAVTKDEYLGVKK